MHKNVLKSISLKFDNYIGNIFYSIFVFAFLFYNSKLILIYFTDTISVNEKIDMLQWSDIVYLEPLISSTILSIVYLTLNFIFYFLTLEYNHLKNKIRDKYLSPKEEIKSIKEERKLYELKQEPSLVNKKALEKSKIRNKGYIN